MLMGKLGLIQDTILGPSNNTDTYLQVYDDSSDKIEARADQFVIQGDSYYLRSKFSSNQVDLETSASKFQNEQASRCEWCLECGQRLWMGGGNDELNQIR